MWTLPFLNRYGGWSLKTCPLASLSLCSSVPVLPWELTLRSSDWAQRYCHPPHADQGSDIVKVTLFVFMFNTHDCLGVVFGSQWCPPTLFLKPTNVLPYSKRDLTRLNKFKGLEMGRPSWITQMGPMGFMRVPLRSKQESQSQRETIGQGKQALEWDILKMLEGSISQRMWSTSKSWKTRRASLLPQLMGYLGRKASGSSMMRLQSSFPSFLCTTVSNKWMLETHSKVAAPDTGSQLLGGPGACVRASWGSPTSRP